MGLNQTGFILTLYARWADRANICTKNVPNDLVDKPLPPKQGRLGPPSSIVPSRLRLPLPAILQNAKNPNWEAKLNRLLQESAWEAVTRHPLSAVKGEERRRTKASPYGGGRYV